MFDRRADPSPGVRWIAVETVETTLSAGREDDMYRDPASQCATNPSIGGSLLESLPENHPNVEVPTDSA